jgi:hypothetical protein
MISRRTFMLLTATAAATSVLNPTKVAFGAGERSALYAGERLNNGGTLRRRAQQGIISLGNEGAEYHEQFT